MNKINALVGSRVKKIFLLLSLSLLVSCVTVNVNFPEGAVQQATDNYVKDLYRAKEKVEDKDSAADKSSYIIPSSPAIFALSNFSFLSQAQAQIKFNVSTAKANKIKDRQRGRIKQLDKYKKKGFLGESEKGTVVIKSKKFRPIQAKKIKKLIEAENDDRMALYKEIANANSSQQAQVIKSFSKSFQDLSPKGTWVQESGNWKQK